MTDRFRVGVIGTGMVAQMAHIPAVLGSPLVDLTALVDPVVERARGIAKTYGIRPTIAADIAEVADQVDGVVIATPNHTHREIALKCAYFAHRDRWFRDRDQMFRHRDHESERSDAGRWL